MIKRWFVRLLLGVGKGQVHCPCCGRFMGRPKRIISRRAFNPHLAAWEDYIREQSLVDDYPPKPKLEIAESQLPHPQFIKTGMELKNDA